MASHKKISPIFTAIMIGFSVTILLQLFSLTTLYKGIKYAASDFKWRQFYQPGLSDPNIVIIAIDQSSIKKFSENYNINWPWPRQFYGIILDYLKKADANVVIFDMLFSESEVGRMDINGEQSESDFSDAIYRYKNVILASRAVDSKENNAESEDSKWMLQFDNAEKLPVFSGFNAIDTPIDSLQKNADSIGIVNFFNDEDGICRRLPLIFNINGSYFPQLAFAAYLNAAADVVIRYDPISNSLITKKQKIKLDDNGNYEINWYGPGGGGKKGCYRYDSFYDVLRSATQVMSGKDPVIPLTEYKNKTVVICATAAGLMDIKPTPFTSLSPYPGGEIHATLLDNLLNRHMSNQSLPIYSAAVFTVFFLMTALIVLSFVFIVKSLTTALTIALAMLILILCTNLYLFHYSAVNMDFIFPVLGIVLTSASSSMYKMFTEGLAKRQIRSIFARYLNDDVINILMKDPDRVDLEGSEITGTVLFTDLQGFTTFAEDKHPKELIKVLNNYFEVITNIVLDRGGYLDKYTGDGIMAIFGAPVEREDHARSACEVILDCRDRNVNELISSRHGNILTRIGISSGPMIVGNLGSERKVDYTAIGDTVNLSARLEGVNKAYGTTNMMSEYTWNFVKDDYFFRELDLIRVKGKNIPIRVFTLIDRINAVCPDRIKIEDRFNNAMEEYRNRNWKDAIKEFQSVLELSPDDSPAKAYIERCRLLTVSSDLVDEHGVFTFKTK